MKTKVSFSAVYAPSEDVVAREIEGEMVIIPITSYATPDEDAIFTLNETGKVIWNNLNGKKTLEQTVEDLVKEYQASGAQIRRDVLGLTGELLKRRMIVEVKRG